ncbi:MULTISPECIES: DUF488 family protein [Methylomonas]|uniref:DUF488 domain-containing protein n=2 Tax=Methylomonas TaxID=416 RepID=A0A126T5G5_9GAMM|nr:MULTISPECIES: DUF488 domain-containing protein [Methylomonas]AMK76984.1 hypothetical protein JT25_010870 [Methylomonas denitrificans]OAH98012.1 hypothetical protein A1342_20080 [Methylomonas methanica]TCV81163.1 uncharacterized protein DUF488 [Methylomonas methanica]
MTIYTIGYEGIDIDAFLALLKKYHIDTVIDIREFPGSRKPGFAKTALSNLLNLSGIEYLHVVALGCPKPVREQYKQDNNWKRYTEGFLKYLHTQDQAIAYVADNAVYSNCALLCYEADYRFCHRSMVANAIRQYNGTDIVHINRAESKTRKIASLPAAVA